MRADGRSEIWRLGDEFSLTSKTNLFSAGQAPANLSIYHVSQLLQKYSPLFIKLFLSYLCVRDAFMRPELSYFNFSLSNLSDLKRAKATFSIIWPSATRPGGPLWQTCWESCGPSSLQSSILQTLSEATSTTAAIITDDEKLDLQCALRRCCHSLCASPLMQAFRAFSCSMQEDGLDV